MKIQIKILKAFLIIMAVIITSFASAIIGIYIVFNNDNSKIPLLNKVDISKKVKNTSVVVEKKDEVHVDKDIQLQNSYKDTKNFISYIAVKKNNGELYFDSDIIGFGVNMTSDGYILTNSNFMSVDKNVNENKRYVVILNDNKVFDVVNFINDKYGFVILKIDNQKMSAPSFLYYDDINIGSIVYSNNGPFGMEMDIIKNKENGFIKLIDNKITKKYGVFDLTNKLLGFYGSDGVLYSSNYLKNIIYSLDGKNGAIIRPEMNLEYLDYTKVLSLDEKKIVGFYITKIDKNFPEFFVGDTIVEIDGYKVKDSLNYMLQNYKVGDLIRFKILRDQKELEISVGLK